MTKDEWFKCKNALLMIEFLWEQEPYRSVAKKFEVYPTSEDWMDYLSFEMALYKFYLSSCRNIWPLLAQEESRKGIELAEGFVEGKVNWDSVSEYNWHVERAAFCFEDPLDQEGIDIWIKDVESHSSDLINKFRHEGKDEACTQELLKQAAYFADYAMIYPSIQPKGLPSYEFNKFLCPKLLRHYIQYPLV